VKQRAFNPPKYIKRNIDTKKRKGVKPRLPQEVKNLKLSKPILFLTYDSFANKCI